MREILATIVLAVALAAMSALGQPPDSCPVLTDEQLPALLFIEGTPEESNLRVAHFRDGSAVQEHVLSAGHVEVHGLDKGVFLVGAKESSREGEYYVVNFGTGETRRVPVDAIAFPLRSDTGRNRLMMMQNTGSGELFDLIEIDYGTGEVVERKTISRERLGDRFEGANRSPRVSPDFSFLAYTSRTKTLAGVERVTTYVLRVLDLDTMEVRDLDPKVTSEIGMMSSFGWGRVPFEWVDENTICYQDIVPRATEASRPGGQMREHVIKTVDVRTGEIREVLRKDMRLELDGGSMSTGPAKGKLVYRSKWILEVESGDLRSRYEPHEVVQEYRGGKGAIYHRGKVVYGGDELIMSICRSPTGANLAYMTRPLHSSDLVARIFAWSSGFETPVIVAEGVSAPTAPLAWIDSLRATD